MTTCSVDGCERKVAARGLCSSHYNRDRVHDNLFTPCHGTLGGGPAKLSPADIGAILDRLVLGDRPAECRDTGLVHVCSFSRASKFHALAVASTRSRPKSGGQGRSIELWSLVACVTLDDTEPHASRAPWSGNCGGLRRFNPGMPLL